MLIMFRIAPNHWIDDRGLDRLLDFLRPYSDSIDEVALFTGYTHAPLPLDTLERRFSRMAAVMPAIRRTLNARVGINVLATMGHHEENLDSSLGEPWQRLVDPSGRRCRGSFCPSDPAMLSYVESLYAAVAEAGPDFIWVDDDVRLMGHAPVSATCFCNLCVDRFNAEYGTGYVRETLVSSLDGGGDEALELRRRWLEHNRNKIADLLSRVERAVHSVSPGLPLGMMTGDRFYEGYDFGSWTVALSGDDRSPVIWRPGGGFYWDDRLSGMFEKAHDIGRQTAALPGEVDVIQSEIENFPYQLMKKSVRTTMLETVAHIAAGATGAALNVLGGFPEPLDEYQPFLDSVREFRPFLAKLRDTLGRSPVLGVFPAWNRDILAFSGTRSDWFGGPSILEALKRQYVLSEIGIPTCYSREGSRVSTLSGATPLAFDDDELTDLLRGGVLMDVAAWHSLKRRGLEHLTGVEPVESFDHDASELITDHPLNGAGRLRMRDCRQSFWPETAHRLGPLSDDTVVLSELRDYDGNNLGPCMTGYENELGGRVVVAGYYPWRLMHNLGKSAQLKAVLSWLSRDSLPVVVEDFAKVVAWARGGDGMTSAVVLFNASLDHIDSLRLRVRTDRKSASIFTSPGSESVISGEGSGGVPGYRSFEISDFAPWTACLLVMGD